MINFPFNMKKHLLLASLTVAFALVAGSVAHAQTKIGYVDMNKIFTGYYKTEIAKKQLEEQQTTAQKELQDLVDVYNKNRDAVGKLNEDLAGPELSKDAKDKKAKERDEKAEELKRQEKNIMELRNTRLKTLQEQMGRMRAGIIDEIRKLINDKVKSDQYDLVLDKSGVSANGLEIVLYSKDSSDFSDDILKMLNANKPKETEASPTPKPEANKTK